MECLQVPVRRDDFRFLERINEVNSSDVSYTDRLYLPRITRHLLKTGELEPVQLYWG